MGDSISTVGDNISTVEGIQYSEGGILISACLDINNDETISMFLYSTMRNFHLEVFRKFKQISVYSRSNLGSP